MIECTVIDRHNYEDATICGHLYESQHTLRHKLVYESMQNVLGYNSYRTHAN